MQKKQEMTNFTSNALSDTILLKGNNEIKSNIIITIDTFFVKWYWKKNNYYNHFYNTTNLMNIDIHII